MVTSIIPLDGNVAEAPFRGGGEEFGAMASLQGRFQARETVVVLGKEQIRSGGVMDYTC